MVKNQQIKTRWVNENVKHVMLFMMLSMFSFSSTIFAREASVAVTLSGKLPMDQGNLSLELPFSLKVPILVRLQMKMENLPYQCLI